MNTFDRARLKYEKNREQQGRALPKAPDYGNSFTAPREELIRPLPEKLVANLELMGKQAGETLRAVETLVKTEEPAINPRTSTVEVTVTVRGERYRMTFDVPGMVGNLPGTAFSTDGMTELIKAALMPKLGKLNVCNLP